MRRFLTTLILLLWTLPAFAQIPMTGAGKGAPGGTAPSFTGTGDVVSGFNAWWSPGIAYSAAYAAPGTNPAADVCDTGGTNCITLNVGTNGLVAAPGATACGGNACVSISKLYDQSGANYCTGPCHLTQSTNASRPVLLTNCGTGTMLCAHFTTAGLTLNGPTLPTIAQPYTIAGAVLTDATNSTFLEILTTPCQAGLFEANDGSVGSHVTAMINAAGSFLTSTSFVTGGSNAAMTGVFNGASSIVSINNNQLTGNPGGNSWSGGATQLGYGGCFSAAKFAGSVLEMGIKGAAFTGTQVTNVTAQQRTNWGF